MKLQQKIKKFYEKQGMEVKDVEINNQGIIHISLGRDYFNKPAYDEKAIIKLANKMNISPFRIRESA